MQQPRLAEEKAALRKRCYARRTAIDATTAEVASDAVAERVVEQIGDFVEARPGVMVSAYWPLAGELDPRPALLSLIERGARAALPRVVGDGMPLDFHAWKPDDQLIEGRFKVMEPAPAAPLVSPQILLVPLLAFDRSARRLGHGKGYYDRTLQGLKVNDPALLAIGLAFAAQEVERVPTNAFDQPLTMVITERAVHHPA